MTEHRPPGRRRTLGDDEIELWLEVARSIRQFPDRTLPKPAAKMAAVPPPPAVRPASTLPAYVPPQPVPRIPGPPALAPLDRKFKQRIARGRVEIDAAIDLHGLRQGEALSALRGFLLSVQAEGGKLVLVVTGKGKARVVDEAGFEREPGVLRRLVPHWLRAPELRAVIVGFEEAAPGHGGAGAVYVRLRRPRASRPA